MLKNRQTMLACLVVLLFGSILFYIGTDGFTAYTAETARVNRLIEDQPKFPDVTFEDSKERTYSIEEFKDKYVFITFMYTMCGTVCPQLERNMGEVYNLLPDKYIGNDIVFLSISFDPTRDNPARLHEYKGMFNSDGETWRMARIPNQEELDSLLKSFGVIVIPDNSGNFMRNSAFYLVDKEGQLVDVMDYTKIKEAADKTIQLLEEGEGE